MSERELKKRQKKEDESDNEFKQLLVIAVIVIIVGLLVVVALSSFEKGSIVKQGLWSDSECDNSAMYEFETITLSFFTIGETRYGDYNTTGDPICIQSYKVIVSNETMSEAIAFKEFDTITEWIKPFELIELELDFSMTEGLTYGAYELTLILEPHNQSKYSRELYAFQVSLVQETQGTELLQTVYYFIIPPIYFVLVYPVNLFVNKRVHSNVKYSKWFTAGTWYYLVKIFLTWFLFFKVTNSQKRQKREYEKLKKKTDKEREKVKKKRKKKRNQTIFQCTSCKCFLKKTDEVCPRCGKELNS